MNHYDHTETGWVIIWTVLAAAALGAAAGGLAGSPVAYIVPAVLLVVLVNFYKLRVTVDGESVRLYMGMGLIRRTVRLADVASAGGVRGTLLWGWGIHYVGGGWIYNVSSMDNVELKFRSGGRLLIGTDDQAGLLAAITPRLAG